MQDKPEVVEAKHRPVVAKEVRPYAKTSCMMCRGVGEVVYVPISGGRTEKLCGCALRRFLKKHGSEVEVKPNGALVWKEVLP